jgi:hypothetical protein
MAQPTPSTNAKAGIFQYLLKLEGSPEEIRAAQAQLSKLTPETAAVYQALNLLPEGGLKSWLMANPIQFWKKVIQLFTGRKYTSGAYVLGERLNDQVYCNGNIGRQQVSDDMVVVAQSVFNQLFGVRLDTSEDLDALDYGVIAYRARPVSQGLSTDAIERAVYLKQHYYPIATYNNACWDLRYFEAFPLVDRIPDHEIGKWYSGQVIGGAVAVNGLIPISASSVLRQYPGSDFDPNTGNITTPDGEVIAPGSGTNQGMENLIDRLISFVKTNPIPSLGIVAALGLAYYESENE